jgi:hypothetical protein
VKKVFFPDCHVPAVVDLTAATAVSHGSSVGFEAAVSCHQQFDIDVPPLVFLVR